MDAGAPTGTGTAGTVNLQYNSANRLQANSTGLDMFGFGIQRLALVTGIDGTATGTTDLFTVPAGRTALVTTVIPYVTSAAGAAGDLAAGVGINANRDDIIASQTLTAFGTGGADDAYSFGPGAPGKFRVADAGEVVRWENDTADTTATTLDFNVAVYGVLL